MIVRFALFDRLVYDYSDLTVLQQIEMNTPPVGFKAYLKMLAVAHSI
jgi:hypothetical protein